MPWLMFREAASVGNEPGFVQAVGSRAETLTFGGISIPISSRELTVTSRYHCDTV